MQRTKIILFIIVLFNSIVCQAQFRQKAALTTPSALGFYSISVQPSLTRYSKQDLADIRILDEENKQVPFIWQTSKYNISPSTFIDLPIVKNTTDSNHTSLEFDLTNVDGTDQLSLTVANTSVTRSASLSGSNDRKNWFIITDHILLSGLAATNSTENEEAIRFPYSKYQYLKLVVRNIKSDPINIVRVGIKKDSTSKETIEYLVNPSTSFTQTDSAGETILYINNPESHLTERISLRVSGTPYYVRNGYVYDHTNRLLATFSLRSDQPSAVIISANKSKTFKLIIENGDNPPLKVDAVRAEQMSRQLIAYLQPGKQYYLATGDSNLLAASYDLNYFRDSIPSTLTGLAHGDVVMNQIAETRTASYQDYWIWPLIVIMIIVLGYLSFRLINDLKKKQA